MIFKKSIILILSLLLLLSYSSYVLGAKIEGTIYDENLNPMKNIVLIVNSVPEQRILISNGSYEIYIEPGNYQLRFVKLNNINESVTENLVVDKNGVFTFDVFFIPDFEEDLYMYEIEDIEEQDFNIFGIEKDKGVKGATFRFIIVVISLVLLFLIYIVVRKTIKNKKKERKDEKEELEVVAKEENKKIELNREDATTDKIIEILKNADGRMTQRELRKIMPYSEAKISLMLAELEEEGRIKRIKKGRGNIIILTKNKKKDVNEKNLVED